MMKKRIRRNLIVCLLIILSMCLYGKAFAEEGWEKHTIAVEGGYATDENGNVIREATVGDPVFLHATNAAGTYVSEWRIGNRTESVNSLSDVISFLMPDSDIKVKAVTKKQTPLTINVFGNSRFEDERSGLDCSVLDYICKCYNTSTDDIRMVYNEDSSDKGVDLDGDGTKDIVFYVAGTRYADLVYTFPKAGASIKGTYKLDRKSNLPYWPILFQFGNNTLKESYSVTVQGGTATDSEGESKASFMASDWLNLHYENNEKKYLIRWEADGIKDFSAFFEPDDYGDVDLLNPSICMPARDLRIRAVTGNKTPYTLDLKKGFATPPEEVRKSIDIFSGVFWDDFDLDGDGTVDLVYADGVVIPASGSNLKGSYVLKELNRGKYWPITIQFGELKESYEIHVTGGHAVDQSGNTVTSAPSGSYITIMRDKEPGKYWKSWKTDYKVNAEKMIFSFVMPARAVNITAETTTTQREYVLDLTEHGKDLKDTDYLLLQNAMYAKFGNMDPEQFNPYGYDLDGNGTSDFSINEAGSLYPGDNPRCISRYAHRYSLGTQFEMQIDDGQIGTLKIVIDNERTELPVPENSGVQYNINIKGAMAKAIDETDPYDYGTAVTKASAGTKIQTEYLPESVPEGKYFVGYMTEGLAGLYYIDDSCIFSELDFYMPPHDITITPIYRDQVPLTIDMSAGPAELTQNFGPYNNLVSKEVTGLEDYAEYDLDSHAYYIDFNRDGSRDILYDDFAGALSLLNPQQWELTAPYTFKNVQRGKNRYYPVTLVFNNKTFYGITKNITSENGAPADSLFEFSCKFEGKNVQAENVPEGTTVSVMFFGIDRGYEIVSLNAETPEGETIFRLDETDIGSFSADRGYAYTFSMPASDLTITGIVRGVEKPSPTPTPSLTPTPTAVNTPSPSGQDGGTREEEEPEEKPKDRDASEDDGISPLFLLIPVAVLAACGVILYVLLRKRNRNSTSVGEPAENVSSPAEQNSVVIEESAGVGNEPPAGHGDLPADKDDETPTDNG